MEARARAVRRRPREDPPRRGARVVRARVHRGARAGRRAVLGGLRRTRRHPAHPRAQRHRRRVAREQRGERARGAQGDAERDRAMPPRRRVDQRPPRARARPRGRRRGPNRRSRPGGLPSDSTENRDDPSRTGVAHRRVRRGEQDDRTGRRRRMRAPRQGVRALRRHLRVAGRVRRRGVGHRDAHRDRQDPGADSSRRRGGGRHAAQAEAGHLRRPAHAHDRCHLPARVADELPLLHQLEVGRTLGPVLHHRGGFQLCQVHLLLQDRGGARGRRDSRGTARRDHHLPRAGHAQDGQEERHRSQAAERRDARMHLGHLQRQDGHAHH